MELSGLQLVTSPPHMLIIIPPQSQTSSPHMLVITISVNVEKGAGLTEGDHITDNGVQLISAGSWKETDYVDIIESKGCN